jgi:hypothetical protein
MVRLKMRTGASVGVLAPIHNRGHCPHPSNHLRRRIHQPSLLPRNIHRKVCAVQDLTPVSVTRIIFVEVLSEGDRSKRNSSIENLENDVIFIVAIVYKFHECYA